MSNSALDFRNRAALFDTAGGKTFDVIIIGGGVTGAGIARDAAMRGLSVVLVDREILRPGRRADLPR